MRTTHPVFDSLFPVRDIGGVRARTRMVYADTALIGSLPIDCPGFDGFGYDVRFGWLALSCQSTDPEALSDATLRLFRIEG